MLIDTVPEGRSPRPEQRRSASDRPNFVKHSRSEPALSTHDECPVSRQAQPGKIESDQAVALQCAANFGLEQVGLMRARITPLGIATHLIVMAGLDPAIST